MLHGIGLKSLYDQRRGLLAWAVALVLLVGLYAAVYPSVSASTSYSDIIDQMPEALRGLFTAGGIGDVSSGPGYVYVELLSLMGPLLFLVYAVSTGAGALAGEEERHTLDLLLALPVTRTRVVVEKFLAMLGGLLLMGGVTWAALVGLGAAVDMHLSTGNTAAAVVHLVLLAAEFGALAVLAGALSGRVVVARAVPSLVAAVGYVLNGLGTTVDWLEPVRKISPFYQYLGHDPIRTGLSATAVGITSLSTLVLVVLAVLAFRRRDVTA
jgi:ABC-2 type transport system permease protein